MFDISILISIAILLFSVIAHEVAHGYVAYLQGDETAYRQGRLTLNPISHLDPVGSFLVPGLLFLSGSRFLFGWAKPVPINENNFVNPRKGMMLCAFAGPLTNFTLAIICSMILKTFRPISWGGFLEEAIFLNLILGIFNLIPIPPLDGSRVVAYFLPNNLLYSYYQLERYGILIIFVLLYLGLLNYLLLLFQPFINLFF